MDDTLCGRLERLVTARTGLLVRERDRERIRSLVGRGSRRLGLRTPEQYVRLLESDSAAARDEWDQLLAGFTNVESFFFRDSGQMDLLRKRVLPELIDACGARRSLFLWSAGC